MFRATTIPRTLSSLSIAPRTSTRTLVQMSLVGRITAPPEKLATKNGDPYFRFGITDRVRNSSGEYEPHNYEVACFDSTREEDLDALKQDDWLHVVADVTPRTYEKSDGTKVMGYRMSVRNFNIVVKSKRTDVEEQEQGVVGEEQVSEGGRY